MRVLLLVLLFQFSVIANAQSTGQGYITELYLHQTGGFLRIKHSQPIINPGCGAGDYYIMEFDGTGKEKKLYAALLTAFNSKKPLSFWVASCTSGQYWNATRPLVGDAYFSAE